MSGEKTDIRRAMVEFKKRLQDSGMDQRTAETTARDTARRVDRKERR
jgi:tyrosyl-tRNA synthetase